MSVDPDHLTAAERAIRLHRVAGLTTGAVP
jgi:hypothetical protein